MKETFKIHNSNKTRQASLPFIFGSPLPWEHTVQNIVVVHCNVLISILPRVLMVKSKQMHYLVSDSSPVLTPIS